jgi:hypothetical protein
MLANNRADWGPHCTLAEQPSTPGPRSRAA